MEGSAVGWVDTPAAEGAVHEPVGVEWRLQGERQVSSAGWKIEAGSDAVRNARDCALVTVTTVQLCVVGGSAGAR